MKILITGASGVIGRVLTKNLCREHDLGLVDIKIPGETKDPDYIEIAKAHTFFQADLSDFLRVDALLRSFKPVAVIHLAAVLGRDTAWFEVFKNIVQSSVFLFESSLSNSVERIIYASSNNVYEGYEREAEMLGHPLYTRENQQLIREDFPPKPFIHYAIAKLMVEEYALFLSGKYNLKTFGLRIGTVREIDDPDLQTGERDLIPRFRTTWLYHSDLVQLVELCIQINIIGGIYNAISGYPGEPGVFIDISKAMRELGYKPKGGIHDRGMHQ